MDFAHTETDKRIEELEKRLQAEYRQAYRETKGKLEKYLSDFARKDEAKRKLVEKGELSQADYKKWRTNQMLTGQRWTKMVDTLARDMNRTNQIAADIINGQLSPTFALNANYAAYGIENGFRTDFGFTLYDQETVNRLVVENPDLLPAPSVDIPADIRWNKQKITSNITQAILQGKSIPEIAKAMETVVGMNKASATTNARTAMTSAQNAGRQETYNKAKAMGIKLEKEWFATNDGKTRHSHAIADGQRVPLDGKFEVGRAKMRYPGDVQNGTPEEIYNCRCTMVTREPDYITKGNMPRMTYSEWYKGKENAENGLKSSSKNGIIRSDGKVDLHNGEHWYEYIGEIDFTSAKAIKSSLLDFEKKYADSKIENCRVITKHGKVFDIHGDKHTVNTNLLGELMNGSINEHNHVTGESQYSFSYEDLLYSALDGSYISSAYDEKFRYKMTFIRKYTEDEVYAAYNKAKEVVYNRSIFEKSIVDEDFQHEFILETCKILNIKYKRVKK